MAGTNFVYKALWFMWLNQAFCPALTFVSAGRTARNWERTIYEQLWAT